MPDPTPTAAALTDYQTQMVGLGTTATGALIFGLALLVFLLALHVTRHI